MARYSSFIIAILLLICSTSSAVLRPDVYFAEGDSARFNVTRDGKVIGTQVGVCRGIEWVEATRETLFVFDMTTNLITQQGGRNIETEITSKACYRKVGVPRYYEFNLKLMNATVSQHGTFSRNGYAGVTTRFGVRQPFNVQLDSWPALFDNNFALQWELAMNMLELPPGDTVIARLVVPQLGEMIPTTIIARPNQVVRFEGENVSVRVLELSELSQILYIAHDGKLLRAQDPKQGITVQRVESGELARVEKPSFFVTLSNRAGPYLLLFGFAAVWAGVIGWRNELRFDAASLFIIGAALYWLSLEIAEPLQQQYFALAINPNSPSNTYMTLLGSALLFALVEQIAILIPIAGSHFLPYKKKLPVYIAIGAACGAGFGLMQSANLTTFTLDGAVVSGELLFQKFGLIGVNAGCGALFGLFLGLRSSFWYYLIPIGIKTFQNWLAAFLQKGSLSQGEYIVVTLLVAVGTVFLFYWLKIKHFRVDKKRG